MCCYFDCGVALFGYLCICMCCFVSLGFAFGLFVYLRVVYCCFELLVLVYRFGFAWILYLLVVLVPFCLGLVDCCYVGDAGCN